MGNVINDPQAIRNIKIAVHAGGAIERVELLKNERLLWRQWRKDSDNRIHSLSRVQIALELEWGSRRGIHMWDVGFGIDDGEIISVEPRIKGPDILAPDDGDTGVYAFSQWVQHNAKSVKFTTRTYGNPTWTTNSNQGFNLEIKPSGQTNVIVKINGRRAKLPLADLIKKPYVNYVDGYDSPAWRVTATTCRDYEWKIELRDKVDGKPLAADRDVYRLRLAQTNNQWAWSSPIWIVR